MSFFQEDYFSELTCKVGKQDTAFSTLRRWPKHHLVPLIGKILGETATHSSILAWEIPWTEETGGLQSMGSQKCRTRLSD